MTDSINLEVNGRKKDYKTSFEWYSTRYQLIDIIYKDSLKLTNRFNLKSYRFNSNFTFSLSNKDLTNVESIILRPEKTNKNNCIISVGLMEYNYDELLKAVKN